jgi:methyl-accepting chemotaxis protein
MFSRFEPVVVLPVIALGAVVAALALAGVLPAALGWIGLGLQLLGLGFAAARAATEARVFAALVDTSQHIRGGDFEARVVLDGLSGRLRRIVDAFNGMIDVNDAFVRESQLAMAAAGEDRFYRKIRPEGLDGAFLQAADKINDTVDRLAERPTLMAELETSFGGVLAAAAAGDFSRRIDAQFSDAVLNRLAQGINDLMATFDRGVSETRAVLSAMAHADLRQRVEGDYRGAFAELKESANTLAGNLEDIIGGIVEASIKLRQAQGQIQSGALDLADRTNVGATAVEQTSAAMEQISVTTSENARKAAAGSQRAEAVSASIATARTTMDEADAAVTRIRTSSEQISGIVSLIDSIAFQTRLLALNASIEAARAGEAGRGFAVVATEVRNLAERVVSASNEIKGLVAESGQQVEHGSILVSNAGTQLGQILGMIRETATDMREIATACGEQAHAVGEVSSAITQLEDNTSQNAALVDRTHAQLRDAESELARLEEMVRRFALRRPIQIAPPAAAPAPRALPAPRAAPAARALPSPAAPRRETAAATPPPMAAPARIAFGGGGAAAVTTAL